MTKIIRILEPSWVKSGVNDLGKLSENILCTADGSDESAPINIVEDGYQVNSNKSTISKSLQNTISSKNSIWYVNTLFEVLRKFLF